MKNNKYKRRESGAVTIEAVTVLCVLFFVFFCFLQLFQWIMAQSFCHYAAYYAAKGMGLGYKINFARRAARVAAIPISGPSRGQQYSSEKLSAQEYMSRGDLSGVWYSYWYPQSAKDPELYLYGYFRNEGFDTRVVLYNAPMLHETIEKVMGVTKHPNPQGKVDFYDYGKIYLDE